MNVLLSQMTQIAAYAQNLATFNITNINNMFTQSGSWTTAMSQTEHNLSLKLQIKNKKQLKALPTLKRPSNDVFSAGLYLRLRKSGIDVGHYSTLAIFTASAKHLHNYVTVWSGTGLKGYDIKKMSFITKSGYVSELTDDMPNQDDLRIPINIDDPIIKIVVE